VHDFFAIVGLSPTARPVEVRRVCARLTRRAHPDFAGVVAVSRSPEPDVVRRRAHLDVAVDFVEISGLLDRMQASFFRP
jgi:hypothetical protein